MNRFLALAGIALLAACSAEPGSQRWCDAQKEVPKTQWSAADAGTFAKNCVVEGTEVGSEKWCKKLEEIPKGEWSAEQGKTYARHCVL